METFAAALADRVLLLDGGLATRMEARGHDLSDMLWSARLLMTDPDEVRATHADFFAAGAEVATTASYQVSESGFEAAGRTAGEAREALRRSVRLAREAAESFDGPRWVAASVGPYGATLADGSEYRGSYGLSVAELRSWHRPRLEILVEAGADLLACETIPSLAETEALAAELAALGVPAWISLTTVGDRTRRGEPASEAYAIAAEVPAVIALGANCCDPDDAVAVVGAVGGRRPVIFYPNSGETWDAGARTWTGRAVVGDSARSWADAGVRALGGCCRVTPDQIAGMAASQRSRHPPD
ncbi:MAG: homocysteine S-methyltransferase [Micropruina sp.]|uniref:homocysteine S-methyltransferase n=1 Tax=Micropruina sp. TaxID=2737536 RepID=UPI0039E42DE5